MNTFMQYNLLGTCHLSLKIFRCLFVSRPLPRGGLTLDALGQGPGAHHFRQPTPTIHDNLKRAQIAVKTAFARGHEWVSDSQSAYAYANQCCDITSLF